MRTISINEMKNSTISRVALDRDRIDLNPTYQRSGDIWTKEKRQLLIDSILNDFDIPKLYFHVPSKPKVLPNGKTSLYAIIDGRQRMETIWKFLDGDLRLAEDFVYFKAPKRKLGGLSLPEISEKFPRLRTIFDSFILPIMIVETDDDGLIEEMFSRLNEAVPLNSAEKRNAFPGAMVKVIREVSRHRFFTRRVNFTNARYQHFEVAVRLLYLENCIRYEGEITDTKKRFLDDFVRGHSQKPKRSTSLKRDVSRILDLMSDVFKNKDSLLKSQASVPIYYLAFRYANQAGKLREINRISLQNFNKRVAENRAKAEAEGEGVDYKLLEFNRMSIQGTNDSSSIRERTRILLKYLRIREPEVL